MTHKGKKILWHKKQGKMIPSKFLKVHGKKADDARDMPASGDKLKDFAAKLTAQIRKAANDPSL